MAACSGALLERLDERRQLTRRHRYTALRARLRIGCRLPARRHQRDGADSDAAERGRRPELTGQPLFTRTTKGIFVR
jgi:hypothetical protein